MRQGDDPDIVPAEEPPRKKAKPNPPDPPPLPDFEPLRIDNDSLHGQCDIDHLPEDIDCQSPIQLFQLFFTDELLKTLVDHTNRYAEMYPPPISEGSRPWYPTTAPEFKAYLAVYIMSSVLTPPDITDFWSCADDIQGCQLINQHISKNRWMQIDRFFHISDPTDEAPKETTPFAKTAPLCDELRALFKHYWLPGKDLAIDELIVGFTGRAEQIVNIPSKPTPEGYKIWAIADEGYILDFLYHAKGSKASQGPLGIQPKWTRGSYGLSKTEAVILELTERLNAEPLHHTIWMDNLFTSADLLGLLRNNGFGAAGTVRTSGQQTATEKDEARNGTISQQKRLKKNKNRGIVPALADLKWTYETSIRWGVLYAYHNPGSGVLQLGWKDQKLVLFMSTIHKGDEWIEKQRRRPASTSTSGQQIRLLFGDQPTKVLPIPGAINDYNLHMNAVDLANQLRSHFTTKRTHQRTWKPLFHWLLDTALINAYKLYCYLNGPSKRSRRRWFIRIIARGFFDQSTRLDRRRAEVPGPCIGASLIKMTSQKRCLLCSAARRKTTMRKPLQELSTNQTKHNTPKSWFGCSKCSLHLCRKGPCEALHCGKID